MGASLSLAGMTGCRWPREKILPFARRDPGHDPGVALRYATACEAGPGVQGLLVTSYDGRPVKIEGNPRHPINHGAADLLAQGSLLGLYDPDRSKAVIKKEGRGRFRSEWGAFEAFWAERSAGWKGRGDDLCILAPPSSSPTRAAMQARLQAVYPAARWHEWEPWHRAAEREGALLAFGRPWRTHLRLEPAQVIVALDDDFLFDHPEALRLAREFAAGRRGDGFRMNRLYVAESAMTQTGGMADHRHATAPSQMPALVAGLAAAVYAKLGAQMPPALAPVAREASRFASSSPFVQMAAEDLAGHRGHAVVTIGPRQPAALHALVEALNAALGAEGTTVTHTLIEDEARSSPDQSLRELVEAMRSGAVGTLVVLGGNPAFDAPADLDFAGALKGVRTALRLGLHEDETTQACFDQCEEAWHLPEAHYLESWGDLRAWDGTLSIVQPLIAPLYDGRTAIEVVAGLAGTGQPKGYELVRETIASRLGAVSTADPFFEPAWRRLLEEGLLIDSARPAGAPELRSDSVAAALAAMAPPEARSAATALEILFAPDHRVWDGRYANNAWLQETPDPLTKITWDSAVLLSPGTAAQLGVKADDLVTIKVGGRSVDLAAYLMPGTAPFTAVVHLGHGRRQAGQVADGRGFDVYPLRTTEGFWSAGAAALSATGRSYPLACTQNHHAIDAIGQKGIDERLPVLIREATLGHYREHPEFARHAVHHPPLESLWPEHVYDGHRWGMAIDLSSCTGCSACVVACTAENNVPVVGKERVSEGREMHWLRLDRYFTGEPESPAVAYQPVACVHCEMAPCEQVCPVAATVHDSEGLNVMVYNRCIGTRYCSNNCPFKVRRFNFFNYRKGLTATEKMAMNPDVTVRSRGVMEKCTYCVQRIEAARITAKNENRAVRDGDVTPACAQTCPTQAIVFGDLNDPASRVAKLQADARSYAMLSELNIKPRTLYLAKLRNPAGEDGHGGHGGDDAHGGAPTADEAGQGGHHEG